MLDSYTYAYAASFGKLRMQHLGGLKPFSLKQLKDDPIERGKRVGPVRAKDVEKKKEGWGKKKGGR